MSFDRPLSAFAAANGAAAVALGAFAAHGAAPAVKALLTTGSHYQLVHAVLALACAAWPHRDRQVLFGGWLAMSGGLVFALALGSIGLLGLRVMGAVAPVGGLLMIAGWIVLLWTALRSHSVNA